MVAFSSSAETNDQNRSKGIPWEVVFKVVGASSILTAIMGWPALGLHYYRYGIPGQFITTESAIRAGILPALLVLLIITYLRFVKSEITRHPTHIMYPGFLFHFIPVGLASFLVKVIGALCGIFWVLKNLTMLLVPGLMEESLTNIILGILSVFLIIALKAPVQRFNQWFNNKLLSDQGIAPFYYGNIHFVDLGKVFLGLFFISKVFPIIGIQFIDNVSWWGMLALSALLAASGIFVTIAVAVSKKETDIGLDNLKGGTPLVILMTILSVCYYSIDLYPSLSNTLGGGAVPPVKMVIDKGQVVLSHGWSVTETEGESIIDQGHIVRFDSKEVIVVNTAYPPGDWIVLPRGAVKSIIPTTKN